MNDFVIGIALSIQKQLRCWKNVQGVCSIFYIYLFPVQFKVKTTTLLQLKYTRFNKTVFRGAILHIFLRHSNLIECKLFNRLKKKK